MATRTIHVPESVKLFWGLTFLLFYPAVFGYVFFYGWNIPLGVITGVVSFFLLATDLKYSSSNR